jgi:hypothetical protein
MSLLSVAVDADTVLFSCEASCGVAWSGCMSREERKSRRALSWPDTPCCTHCAVAFIGKLKFNKLSLCVRVLCFVELVVLPKVL